MASVAHGKFSGRRLVIAGCGYVGTALAERMLQHGAAVTAITRNASAAAALRAGGVDAIVADLASDGWYGAISGVPDFVVNCVSGGGGGIEGYRHSYLEGMQSLVRWAWGVGGVGTIVYTSSTSVYPQGEGAVVSEGGESESESERESESESEDERERERESERERERAGESDGAKAGAKAGADKRQLARTPQAEILLEAERVLAESAGAFRRWFILRLAGIYGPGRHYLLDQVRSGSVAGHGTHRLNLAHRDDIVAAICACLTAPAALTHEVFNVADDAPTAKAEVVAWLADRLAVPRPSFTGVPAGARRAVTPDRIIANGKLKTVLGWKPQFPSFREGYGAILAPPV